MLFSQLNTVISTVRQCSVPRLWSVPVLFSFVLLLIGCTRPPEIPKLDPPALPDPQDVVMDGELSPVDVRRIFHSINRQGKLNSLRPWIETSNENLTTVTRVISRYLYQQAQDEQGLLSLLEQRIRSRSFSRWLTLVTSLAKTKGFSEGRETFLSLLSEPNLHELIRQDAKLLDPAFADVFALCRKAAREEFKPKFKPSTFQPVSREAFVADVQTFLNDRERHADFLSLWERTTFSDFGMSSLKAFSRLQNTYGSAAFEGLALRLGEMTSIPISSEPPSPTQMDSLIALLKNLNGSGKLFEALQDKLVKNPDLLRNVGMFLQSMVPKAVAGIMRESLSNLNTNNQKKLFWVSLAESKPTDPPSKQWRSVFFAIQDSVMNVVGKATDQNTGNPFVSNLSLYLNTYALTQWLVGTVREHSDWFKGLGEEDFAKIWDRPLDPRPLTVKLAEKGPDSKLRLFDDVSNKLKSVDLGVFAEELSRAITSNALGDFTYDFPVNPLAKTLREQLNDAVQICHKVRLFADPSSFVRALVFKITRKEGNDNITLADLDTDDLLLHLNTFIGAQSLTSLRKIKRVMFEDLNLGRLSDQEKGFILSFYVDADKTVISRVSALMDNMQSLYELDRSFRGLPSPFESYRMLLSYIPPEAMGAVSKIAKLIVEGNFLGSKAGSPSKAYPAIFQAIQNGVGLSSFLYGISQVSDRKRQQFLMPLADALDYDGMKTHFNLLLSLNKAQRNGVSFWLGKLYDSGWDVVPSNQEIFPPERAWLSGFLGSAEFPELWRYFRSHGSRQEWRSLLAELRTLSERGYLAESVGLLAHIHNDNIRRISEVLSEWLKSGEFSAFLSTLAKFVE